MANHARLERRGCLIPVSYNTVHDMNSIPYWFDRNFSSPYTPELLPNLLARIRGTPARLEDLLSNQDSARLTAKPGDRWSPQEHAGHVMDLEPLWLARIEDFVNGKPVLTVADLTNRKTHEGRHNERPLSKIFAEFRKGRGRLLERVETVAPEDWKVAIPHPRLKTPMHLADHLYFVAEHDDHHLAYIWELLNTRA